MKKRFFSSVSLLEIKNGYSTIMILLKYHEIKYTSPSVIESKPTTQKGNIQCKVGVQRSYFSWIIAAKWDYKIGKILFPNSSFESKNRIKATKTDELLGHDNACHRITTDVRHHLNEYGRDVLCHSPYSPDLGL